MRFPTSPPKTGNPVTIWLIGKVKNVLGFGLSAHSYFKSLPGDYGSQRGYGVRFWNSPHLKTYMRQVQEGVCDKSPLDNLPQNQREFLKIHEALTDFCHTRLRKKEGFFSQRAFLFFPSGDLKNRSSPGSLN